jgi:hypothetical protein
MKNMKKIVLIISSFFIINICLSAQDNTPAPSKEHPDMMEGLKDMQERLKQFFGNGLDSTEGFSFRMNPDMIKMDTSMSKSYGFMFDGENWKSLTPGGDSLSNGFGGDKMGDIFKQMQEQMKKLMPDMKDGFDMSEMFKGFGNFFGDDSMISPMPRIEPKDKKRLGEEPSKEKKYKTEKL